MEPKALASIFAIILFACPSDQNSKLDGHWHRYVGGRDYSLLSTVDVLDSMTITNRYVIHGERLIFPRINDKGVRILPFNTFNESTDFSIQNDTLFIWNGRSSPPERFVRSNLEDCKLHDLYGYTRLEIELPKGKADTNFEFSYRNYCTKDVYVGRPRKEYYDELRTLYSDSVFVQVNDVFMTLDHLPKVWRNVTHDCENMRGNINIHADSSVSSRFLQRIEELIPDSLSIHSAIVIDGDSIGLAKVRN